MNFKNKLGIFAIALAGMTMAACSSEDMADTSAKTNTTSGTTGYVTVAINVPQTSKATTRAASSTEDAVNSGTLYIFKGSSESGATLIDTESLTDMESSTGDGTTATTI